MDLNEGQKKAVHFYEGACNVLASAGSGKTGVLVHRIAYLMNHYGVPPYNILAVTFNRPAMESLRERLKMLLPDTYKGVNVETFHSLGYGLMRKFDPRGQWPILGNHERDQFIEQVLTGQCGITSPGGHALVEARQYISLCKAKLTVPSCPHGDDSFVERAYWFYEKKKQARRVIDYDDLLAVTDELLHDDEVVSYCKAKYRFILVDEMQDTNAAQYEMIRMISGESGNVMLVSDPLQAIYGWRGGDSSYVLDFDEQWPNAETIRLNTNYRSTQPIVSLANTFAKQLPYAAHKHYVESIAARAGGDAPEYKLYRSEDDEAEDIIDRIKSYHKNGVPYDEIAILTRTNAQLQNFATSLFENDIPVIDKCGVDFMGRKEIKIIMSYLKLSMDTGDNASFLYIYNKPNRYLGNVFLEAVKQCANKKEISLYDAVSYVALAMPKYKRGISQLQEVVSGLKSRRFKNVGAQISWLRKKLDLDSYVVAQSNADNDDSAIENMDTLQFQAEGYEKLGDYLHFMEQFTRDAGSTKDGVRLLTIHKSKGLEFSVVFLVNVNEGILPHYRNDEIDEEKRLMYVAMTRAKDMLHVSSTQKYMGRDTYPSEFLDSIFPGKKYEIVKGGKAQKGTKRICARKKNVK